MSNDRPMVLAVLADFGGRRAPGSRRLVRVDRSTLDDVMARMGVEAVVPDAESTVTLRFAGMEDFHPDAFAPRVRGLVDRAVGGEQPAPPPERSDTASPAPQVGSLLDAILGDAPEEVPARDAVREFARRVAEPSTERPSPAPGGTDRRVADVVRAVLHAPRFRALESAWRGLEALVQVAETGPALEIRVLDASRDEAPMALAEELAVPGAPRPSCVLAAYAFGPEEGDLAVLERFGAVALAAGVPLYADASQRLLGLREMRELGEPDVRRRIGLGPGPDAWRAFRALPAAANVTLCLPRVLLRSPYGASRERVASFAFEEGLTGRDHESFLWGSAALAYGRVLARAFAAEGWDAALERYASIEGLPVHVWREGGEERVLPCAEVVMSEATVGRVAEEGLMVLASVRDQDRATFRRASARPSA